MVVRLSYEPDDTCVFMVAFTREKWSALYVKVCIPYSNAIQCTWYDSALWINNIKFIVEIKDGDRAAM